MDSDVWRCKTCNRVSRCTVIMCPMPESPSQDNRTSHHSTHGDHRKSLRKRWPMVTLCSKHKNDPFKGQIGRGKHPKGRKTIMHGTNSGILRALFCAPADIYRPDFLKLNLTMTARHDPGQWSMCGSLCPYESVTPKPCSWGTLGVPNVKAGKEFFNAFVCSKSPEKETGSSFLFKSPMAKKQGTYLVSGKGRVCNFKFSA
jgi:hypothetical protein